MSNKRPTRRAKQFNFFEALKISTSLEHGGDTRKGRRKTARPFDPKRPLHVVMRSTRARGGWSLLAPQNRGRVEAALEQTQNRYGLEVYRWANVGNHLHLLIKAPSRRLLQTFLRVLAGRIAFEIMHAKKGEQKGRFWDRLVYSRVVSWGRELETLKTYIVKNLFEAAGAWNRKKNPNWKIATFHFQPPPFASP